MPEKTLPKVIVITGPTATGKTSIGIKLAKKLNGEIISADSRQVYKLMDIGTAKPGLEERKEISHHLIDICFPDQTYSAGLFAKDANSLIEQILNRGKMPIIVGGTGLYLKALLQGIFAGPGADPKIRERLNQEVEQYGLHKVYARLQELDQAAAAKISPKDRIRTIRALEIYELTGKPISYWQSHKESIVSRFKFICFGIDLDRKKLYEKINLRVDQMMSNGFLNEVRNIDRLGYSFDLPALRTFGYLDVLDYLQGRIGLEDATEIFKQKTRNFAKRQLTWFRHQLELSWIEAQTANSDEVILEALARV
jgi:tRNA dimethylallyltransferase